MLLLTFWFLTYELDRIHAPKSGTVHGKTNRVVQRVEKPTDPDGLACGDPAENIQVGCRNDKAGPTTGASQGSYRQSNRTLGNSYGTT